MIGYRKRGLITTKFVLRYVPLKIEMQNFTKKLSLAQISICNRWVSCAIWEK